MTERVFETQHPYHKYFTPLSETISYPRALAYSIEMDKKCNLNRGNLILKTKEFSNHINDYFSTKIEINRRPASE